MKCTSSSDSISLDRYTCTLYSCNILYMDDNNLIDRNNSRNVPAWVIPIDV